MISPTRQAAPVDERGELALRGQVLDVFAAQAGDPVRIDADGGRIAAIRRSDLMDQRTLGSLDQARTAPAADAPRTGPAVRLLDHLPGSPARPDWSPTWPRAAARQRA